MYKQYSHTHALTHTTTTTTKCTAKMMEAESWDFSMVVAKLSLFHQGGVGGGSPIEVIGTDVFIGVNTS